MHHACGSLLSEDVIVHFRKLQILVDDEELSVIAAYHILDGIDHCCVGSASTAHMAFVLFLVVLLSHYRCVLILVGLCPSVMYCLFFYHP